MTKQQSNYIKLIAMISMFIDHVGVILFPDQVMYRIIGRIAFPLFAYQIGVGYSHTSNLKKYLIRILSFGGCVQFFYIAAVLFFNLNEDIRYLNIFFTLTLGLLAIVTYQKKNIFYSYL